MLDNVRLGLTYLQDARIYKINVHPFYHAYGCTAVFCRNGSYADSGRGMCPRTGLGWRGIPVEDVRILTDIQEGTDYSRLVQHQDLSALHFDFPLRLMKDKPFYGAGPHQLLPPQKRLRLY